MRSRLFLKSIALFSSFLILSAFCLGLASNLNLKEGKAGEIFDYDFTEDFSSYVASTSYINEKTYGNFKGVGCVSTTSSYAIDGNTFVMKLNKGEANASRQLFIDTTGYAKIVFDIKLTTPSKTYVDLGCNLPIITDETNAKGIVYTKGYKEVIVTFSSFSTPENNYFVGIDNVEFYKLSKESTPSKPIYTANNYYYHKIESSLDVITDLALIIRNNVKYVRFDESTSINIHNYSKGGQFIFYDSSDVIYPEIGWPENGVFTVDGSSYYLDREHVWPCSNMKIKPAGGSRSVSSFSDFVRNEDDSYDYRPSSSNRGHFSDMHNLITATREANQNLHNDNFFKDEKGNSKTPYKENGFFYPGDEFKGDVARILFYMSLMYPYLTLGDETNLKGSIFYGDLETLRRWDKEDPVSQEEIDRNNLIFKKQRNRNPFIDLYEINIADIVFANGDVEVPVATN